MMNRRSNDVTANAAGVRAAASGDSLAPCPAERADRSSGGERRRMRATRDQHPASAQTAALPCSVLILLLVIENSAGRPPSLASRHRDPFKDLSLRRQIAYIAAGLAGCVLAIPGSILVIALLVACSLIVLVEPFGVIGKRDAQDYCQEVPLAACPASESARHWPWLPMSCFRKPEPLALAPSRTTWCGSKMACRGKNRPPSRCRLIKRPPRPPRPRSSDPPAHPDRACAPAALDRRAGVLTLVDQERALLPEQVRTIDRTQQPLPRARLHSLSARRPATLRRYGPGRRFSSRRVNHGSARGRYFQSRRSGPMGSISMAGKRLMMDRSAIGNTCSVARCPALP